MKKVFIFTDGACKGNPGPGGWGAILRYDEFEKRLSGYCDNTTNNRMELEGVINALSALKKPCDVVLSTDSKYVVNAINQGWLHAWKRNNWLNKKNKPISNPDLWTKLAELINIHVVSFEWIKGHSGHKENEECDLMANIEIFKNNNL